MLYFVGIKPGDLPPFPLNLHPPSNIISTSRSGTLTEIPKKDRSSTPAHMIEYFIEVMQIINNKNQMPCITK
jgi:hypothetical protein